MLIIVLKHLLPTPVCLLVAWMQVASIFPFKTLNLSVVLFCKCKSVELFFVRTHNLHAFCVCIYCIAFMYVKITME